MTFITNNVLTIAMIVFCLLFLVYTVYLVKRNKLLLRYSLLWMLLSILILLVAIFPAPVYQLASWLGFTVGSNFVIVAALFFLLLLCLTQSRAISQQTLKITRNVQQAALLEKQLEDLKKKTD